MIFTFGCATQRSQYYKIRKGEDLSLIASKFGTTEESIVDVNKDLAADNFIPGKIILIPAIKDKKSKRGLLDMILDTEILKVHHLEAPSSDGKLIWPIKDSKISSPYGMRGKHFHQGIDIEGKAGDPVNAADSGVVIYSGNKIKGYGNLIVIRHSNELTTVYAHNKKNLVKEGELVVKGQEIAKLGQTGNATGPHLHFEVRINKEAKDPLKYLVPTALASKK